MILAMNLSDAVDDNRRFLAEQGGLDDARH